MTEYKFGEFLYTLRVEAGLTQFQLGKLVGVSDKAVSKWENGSSKPQSDILYKLGEVLGVSVDELLSCKHNSFKSKDRSEIRCLWQKASDIMQERYSYNGVVPIKILNRFLSEQAEMENTETILYFDFLSVLAKQAKRYGEHIRVKGGVGSCFVAYLLGATEMDPIEPHYYSSDCRKVILDGQVIPFEVYRNDMQRNVNLCIDISPVFLPIAKKYAHEYFKSYKIKKEERCGNITIITVTTRISEVKITLFVDNELSRYKTLEQVTATSFERICYDTEEVLQEFQKGNTDGITDFGSAFTKNILYKTSARSFNDLVQITGLSHGMGAWRDNAELLIEQGVGVGKVIAYRDDVFNYIQERMISRGMTDTGFAYKVMESVQRGIYSKNGIPDDVKYHLKAIGAEDWFVDSIVKIKYLFQKAHGIAYVRSAAILMWYKLNYPKEFNEIMIS